MKLGKILICMTALGAMLVMSAMAADSLGTLPPEGANAYLETVQSLAKQNGVNRSSKVDPVFLTGLSCSRIIDFDGDGIPELYCAWGNNNDDLVQHQAIWSYTTSGLQRIFYQDSISNFGTDVSPETLLYVGNTNAYLVDGRAVMNGGLVTYYTKSGNGMIKALTYTDEIGDSEHICTLNGKSVSEEEQSTFLQNFTAGMTEYSYLHMNDPYAGQDVTTTVTQSIELLKTLVYPNAKTSSAKLQIDGQEVSLNAYQINGNNYYKLRDLAYALNGSGKQFAVTWNQQQKRIDLLPKKPYETIGGEGDSVKGTAQASLSSTNIWMNNEKFPLTAYQIYGNNYLKLRDLASAMDFGVTWDNRTQCISVDTKKSYQAD